MSFSKLSRVTKEHYTLAEIEKALKNEHLLYSYAEAGDLESIHLLIDAERALEQAQPTDIQLKTVDLVWKHGYSLVESGKLLSVTPQAVKFNLGLLKVKIQRVLDEWRLAEMGESTDED
ncbi:hypothetical protein ABEU97_20520 [Priestia megaterium]